MSESKKGDKRVKDGRIWTCTDPDIDRWVTSVVPQEPLGADFEKVLRENLWDLYSDENPEGDRNG